MKKSSVLFFIAVAFSLSLGQRALSQSGIRILRQDAILPVYIAPSPASPGLSSGLLFTRPENEPGFLANGLLNYKGFNLDIGPLFNLPNRAAILQALRRQIDMVDEIEIRPQQKTFFKSIPIGLSLTLRDATGRSDNGAYYGTSKSIELTPSVFDEHQPILLHELLHGYHDQRLAGGASNPDVLRLYEQARISGHFPSTSYMLSSSKEYFAMMATVFLTGSDTRAPYTRDDIRALQPDCYKWLEQEFGPR